MNWNELQDVILRVAAEWKAPGVAVGIVQDGELVFAHGFGTLQVDRPEAVDAHTQFAIASCSKAFTTAAVAMLADEKRLRLDDRVSEYLPEFQLYDPYVTRELTVRDLMCHRSGLKTFSGDLVWFGTRYSQDEVLRRTRFIKPAHSFRSQYGYQNIMFVAAGKIVEVVSGQSWGNFIRTRILDPLGMHDTTTSVSQLASRANVARPHIERQGELIPIDYVNIDNELPAGGLNSSIADMAQWIRLQLNHGQLGGQVVFSPAMAQEMWTPHTLIPIDAPTAKLYPSTHFRAYGLGWFLSDYLGRKMIEHGGGLPGMVSHVGLMPEERLGFVTLTSSETPVATIVRNTIVDMALNQPPKDWSAELRAIRQAEVEARHAADRKLEAKRVRNTRPSLPLEMYAGRYSCPLYGDVEVRLEDGRLAVYFQPSPDIVGDLDHWHYETFRVTWRSKYFPTGLVNFTLDAHGAPVEMKIDAPNRDFDFTELELKRVPGED